MTKQLIRTVLLALASILLMTPAFAQKTAEKAAKAGSECCVVCDAGKAICKTTTECCKGFAKDCCKGTKTGCCKTVTTNCCTSPTKSAATAGKSVASAKTTKARETAKTAKT